MALPVTIASSSLPSRNYYCGPFISGGNVYAVILVDASGRPKVVKNTDPDTSSFTVPDSANIPTTVPDAMWVYQDGTTLHITTHDFDGDGGDGEVLYHEFSMSSDTWTITDQTIEIGIKGQTAASASVSIAIRSDGDRIVLYGGDPDADMGTEFDRVDYARWEGASWTAGIDVGGTSPANQHRRGTSVVRGSSDNMHFFWGNVTALALAARTLDPTTNNLSTTRTNAFVSVPDHMCRNGISYNDGGTQRVIVPLGRVSALPGVARLVEDGSGDVGTISLTTVGDGTNLTQMINGTGVLSGALDNTTLHLLWANANDTQDLYRDSAAAPQTSWGTDIEFLDGVTINRISINAYDRGGTKLAMVYDNDGTVQYNEIDLAVAEKLMTRIRLLTPAIQQTTRGRYGR